MSTDPADPIEYPDEMRPGETRTYFETKYCLIEPDGTPRILKGGHRHRMAADGFVAYLYTRPEIKWIELYEVTRTRESI